MSVPRIAHVATWCLCLTAYPALAQVLAGPRAVWQQLREEPAYPPPVPSGPAVRASDFQPESSYSPWRPPRGRWDWRRVKALAHDVDAKARHIYYEAARRQHHGDRREWSALQDLGRLSSSAAHFHRQVESFRSDPRHTAADYYALVQAYNQARWSVRWAHVEAHVLRDFEAVAGSLQELDAVYNGHGGGHGGHDDDHWEDHGDGHGHDRRRPRGGWSF